jgi:hypothetical protein
VKIENWGVKCVDLRCSRTKVYARAARLLLSYQFSILTFVYPSDQSVIFEKAIARVDNFKSTTDVIPA